MILRGGYLAKLAPAWKLGVWESVRLVHKAASMFNTNMLRMFFFCSIAFELEQLNPVLRRPKSRLRIGSETIAKTNRNSPSLKQPNIVGQDSITPVLGM